MSQPTPDDLAQFLSNLLGNIPKNADVTPVYRVFFDIMIDKMSQKEIVIAAAKLIEHAEPLELQMIQKMAEKQIERRPKP